MSANSKDAIRVDVAEMTGFMWLAMLGMRRIGDLVLSASTSTQWRNAILEVIISESPPPLPRDRCVAARRWRKAASRRQQRDCRRRSHRLDMRAPDGMSNVSSSFTTPEIPRLVRFAHSLGMTGRRNDSLRSLGMTGLFRPQCHRRLNPQCTERGHDAGEGADTEHQERVRDE
jgi:hypothetical protein